jgi:hypothetical protein
MVGAVTGEAGNVWFFPFELVVLVLVVIIVVDMSVLDGEVVSSALAPAEGETTGLPAVPAV